MLFQSMFDQVAPRAPRLHDYARLLMQRHDWTVQVPHQKRYLTDPANEGTQVRDFEHLLRLLNHVITTAPEWTDAGHSAGLVGVPVQALLDWPMGTTAGYCVFLDPHVNEHLKKILDVWSQFLSSPESSYVLGSGKTHWFGPTGLPSLEEVANVGQADLKFHELFESDPTKEHYGFRSWDDFFTRRFRPDVRPVAAADNDDIVANACESHVYKVAFDIAAREKFYVKGQPYSVYDILNFDPLAEAFVGGTIYQAFLSALSYHRWHSPVSGTIIKAYVVPGTYFSEPLYTDFTSDHPADPQGESTSQEYLSCVATRALIFIKADNPKLGTICFVGIGMTEVSTCDVAVKPGQHLVKGDELGYVVLGLTRLLFSPLL